MTTPDQPDAPPCDVRYPSTDPTARIVHCGLPWRHDGDHAEEDGAPTWPRMPLAEAIVRTVAPTKADLERAEQAAAYGRGVAEGAGDSCPACATQPRDPDLGEHHAHVTDYGYVLYDPAHRQDLAGGLIALGRRQAAEDAIVEHGLLTWLDAPPSDAP